MVRRSGVIIMLSQPQPPPTVRPNHLSHADSDAWDAYVWVDDADRLYRELQAKNVTIARPICDQPYGNRDFDVEDCNGYRLCFGSDLGR